MPRTNAHVLLTEDADYRNLARKLGAAKVLGKPFSHQVLIAAIADVLADGGVAAPTVVVS